MPRLKTIGFLTGLATDQIHQFKLEELFNSSIINFRYLQATLDPKLVSAHEAHVVLSAAARRQPGRLLAWRHLRTRPSSPPPELLLAVAEHMSGADDYKEVRN